MQSKVNIFHNLQHNSDSEEENDAQTNKTKKIAEKREQRAKTDDKSKPTANKQGQPAGNVEKPAKEDHSKAKAPYKAKGVSDQPHPLDRHSGHKNQAYGEKPKKSGAGKGNWGNYNEDRKGGNDEGRENRETVEEAVEAPEEPAGITLSEYYQQRGQAQNEPQINEAKAKITSEQLTKELGTATVLKTKAQQQIDDKKVGKKKDRLDVNHHAAINSENANLLGFRTGFVEKEFRPRGEDGAPLPRQGQQGPRTGGQRERENAKEEEGQPQTAEGQTTEAQPAEGEGNQVQEGTAEGQTPTRTQQEGQDNQNRGKYEGQRGGRGGSRGGYRGNRQGDRPQGDRPQGDRPQGDRPQGDRPYNDRPRKPQAGKDQAQLKFDETAFPKLG